jgi:GTPase SAR1 family protein
MAGQDYERFYAAQKQLISIMTDINEASEILSLAELDQRLKTLVNKVQNDTLKIQVVGSFKNGKSTFINSFLGEEVLPAYMTPCTAVITELKYGENKRAVLHFRDPLPDPLPANIPYDALTHMKSHGMQHVPAIDIPVDALEAYTVIPMDVNDPSQMLLESPYERIELFWPLELLKNHVEVIDSPGLNENRTRTEVAMRYLAQADALLFVFKANSPCSMDEMDFIDNHVVAQGFEETFFLVNWFDIILPRDVERVKQFFHMKLQDKSKLGKSGIFFISSYNALRGKLNSEDKLLESSGMPEFENVLSNYLITNRGKAKLLQPIRSIKSIVNRDLLEAAIPQMLGMLDVSLETLVQKIEEAKPQLESLKMQKQQVELKIERKISFMLPDIRRSISRFMNDLQAQVDIWINDYNPTNSVSILPWKMKSSVETVSREICEHVTSKIDEYQAQWNKSTLTPLISGKMEEIKDTIEANVNDFYITLDSLSQNLTGISLHGPNQPKPLERLLAAGVGLLGGGLDNMVLGGMMGFSPAFIKGLITEIGLLLLLNLFSLLNPITLIAVVAGAILKAVFGNASSLMNSVKGEVIKQINLLLNEKNQDIQDQFVDKLSCCFDGMKSNITEGLDSEIGMLNSKINEAKKNLERGKTEVNKKRELYRACQGKLREADSQLDELLMDIAQKY